MTLYTHQQNAIDTIETVLNIKHFAALFMEMGTGKTRCALELFKRVAGQFITGDCLVVVAPKSILTSWEMEIGKVYDFPYSVIRWDATKSSTKKWQEAFNNTMQSPCPIFLVNIESMQPPNERLIASLKQCYNGRNMFLVCDESSTIKTHNAQRTKNMIKLGMKAAFRLILTGTEITNSPLDLYSQFEFLSPGFWGLKNFFLFRAYYSIIEDGYTSRGKYPIIKGFNHMDEMQARISPYIFRALKKDCLDLPPKIYAPIYVEATAKERQAYDALKRDLMLLLESGELLTVANKMSLFGKFRQVVGGAVIHGESVNVIEEHPSKLRALLDDIEDTSEQAIVWAAFTHQITMLVDVLQKHGGAVRFDGETSTTHREKAMQEFTAGKVRFFVANPAACSMGINLQAAHLQYFYSRTLSPTENAQAEDRIHRIGQDSPCVYKSIISQGTVDERIEAILAQKKDIRESFQNMTIADMIELVK